MKCPKCGTNYEDSFKFCPNCGEAHPPVANIQPPQQPPIIQQPTVPSPPKQVSQPPAQAITPEVAPPTPPPYLTKPEPRTTFFSRHRIPIIVGAAALVTLVVGLVIFLALFFSLSGKGYEKYKKRAEVVMKQLQKVDDKLDTSILPAVYVENVTSVNSAFKEFGRQCSEKEKEYDSYEAISSARDQYINASGDWQTQIDDPDVSEVDFTNIQDCWLTAQEDISSAQDYLKEGK